MGANYGLGFMQGLNQGIATTAPLHQMKRERKMDREREIEREDRAHRQAVMDADRAESMTMQREERADRRTREGERFSREQKTWAKQDALDADLMALGENYDQAVQSISKPPAAEAGGGIGVQQADPASSKANAAERGALLTTANRTYKSQARDLAIKHGRPDLAESFARSIRSDAEQDRLEQAAVRGDEEAKANALEMQAQRQQRGMANALGLFDRGVKPGPTLDAAATAELFGTGEIRGFSVTPEGVVSGKFFRDGQEVGNVSLPRDRLDAMLRDNSGKVAEDDKLLAEQVGGEITDLMRQQTDIRKELASVAVADEQRQEYEGLLGAIRQELSSKRQAYQEIVKGARKPASRGERQGISVSEQPAASPLGRLDQQAPTIPGTGSDQSRQVLRNERKSLEQTDYPDEASAIRAIQAAAKKGLVGGGEVVTVRINGQPVEIETAAKGSTTKQ